MAFRFTFRGADMQDLGPATQDLLENRDQELELWAEYAVPVGGILRWHNAPIDPPPGWLRTNGASVAVNDYLSLFNVIGYTYGGSGANFTLPNYSYYIIRH